MVPDPGPSYRWVGVRSRRFSERLGWINVIFGTWVIGSALTRTPQPFCFWNELIVGILSTGVALWSSPTSLWHSLVGALAGTWLFLSAIFPSDETTCHGEHLHLLMGGAITLAGLAGAMQARLRTPR